MLAFLEERIEQLQRVKDPAWRALLGSWLVGAGCLRYRHVSVSVPRKITMSSFHAFCAQGKQAQNREGFYWSTFTTGFSWVEGWLESYSALTDVHKAECGLCFDAGGTRFSLDSVATPKDWWNRSRTSPPTRLGAWPRLLATCCTSSQRKWWRWAVGRRSLRLLHPRQPCPCTNVQPAAPSRCGASIVCFRLWANWQPIQAWELVPEEVLRAADVKGKGRGRPSSNSRQACRSRLVPAVRGADGECGSVQALSPHPVSQEWGSFALCLQCWYMSARRRSLRRQTPLCRGLANRAGLWW